MPSYESDPPCVIADLHHVDNVSDYIQWPYGIPATPYEHVHGIIASVSATANAYYPHTFPASQGTSQGYPLQGYLSSGGLSRKVDELCAVTHDSTSDPLLSVTEEADAWLYQETIPVLYDSSCFNPIQSQELWHNISDIHVNNAILTADPPIDNVYSESEACGQVRSHQSFIEMESPHSHSPGACDELDPVPPHMIVPSQQSILDYKDQELRDLSSFDRGFSRTYFPPLLQKQQAIGQVPGLDGPNTPDTCPYDSPSPQTPGFQSASFNSADTGSSSSNLPFDSEHEGDEYANHQAQYPSHREVFSTFTSALKDALNEAKVSSPVRIKDVVKFDVQQPSDPRHSLLRVPSAKTKDSPRLAGAPYPPSARRSSASLTKKSADKKPPLACLFCRGRKIACGAPTPGSIDKTCNQCARRQLTCEYPLESRRGMKRKKTSVANATGLAISTD